MKAMKKNDLGVSPVIAVILMVAITVVLAGVVFLWAQSFTDDADGDVENLDITVSISGATDAMTIQVTSGTYTWSEYRVTVDGATLDTPSVATTSAGQSTVYTDSTTTFDVDAQDSVHVIITHIEENRIVWQDDGKIVGP